MQQTSEKINQKVADLLASDAVTEPTFIALQKRLGKKEGESQFFSDYDFKLLNTVCDRLVDQDPTDRFVNIALLIDDRLTQGLCDGWRYDDMPPDYIMLPQGLKGIDETAGLVYQKAFMELEKQGQLNILNAVQQGRATGKTWLSLSSKRFFEELLAETVEIFFSNPAVQLHIGYKGMADAYGWENIGLNEHDENVY